MFSLYDIQPIQLALYIQELLLLLKKYTYI